jgi:hypothetical protein
LRVALAVGLFAVGGWFAVRGLFALAVSAWWETSDDPLDGPVMVLWGLQVVVALGLPALLARLLLGRRARWWLLALGAVGGVLLGYVAFAVPVIVEELTETP